MSLEAQNPNESQSPELVKVKNKAYRLWLIIILIVVILLAGGVYFFWPENNQTDSTSRKTNPLEKIVEKITQPLVSLASEFATYVEVPVNYQPQVPAYTVQEDLSNVVNIEDFYLSDEVQKLLAKNAFAVQPSYFSEFFSLYEKNRYGYIPSFVTTDSILHNYHLMFDFLLKDLEEGELIPELKKLNTAMLAESLEQYQNLKGTEWEIAAQRNVGFFAVGSKLLDDSIVVPSIVQNEVATELSFIASHQGVNESPVMNLGDEEESQILATPQGDLPVGPLLEDYSQYIPRGHYDKTEELKAYFKSMMWYGRLSFRMKKENEIKSALLITLVLNQEKNHQSWDKIYEPINFFVGKSDDINYYQFRDLAIQTYGDDVDLNKVIAEPDKFNDFVQATVVLDPPQINSMPIFESSIQEDREKEIKGFRFFGQRFTIDASIFQRLMYREVGDQTTTCANYDPVDTGCQSGARCLPKSLDIVATLGSNEAENILEDWGETDYACYNENLNKMQSYVSALPTTIWTQNLYWGWLYQLLPLTIEKTTGYPSFMNNLAWTRKQINTFLGSWTELKHDTILYAKQAYAELGGGPGPEEKDDRGYVEPQPEIYARLAGLVQMTKEGLQIRDILPTKMEENLDLMAELSLSLKTISEKELNNQNLSEEEYELIRSYGGQLEHFWLEINQDEPEFESSGRNNYLNENPAAIVADVATDPNGRVLEEGTGHVFEIYVVVPIEGRLKLTRGGVYSYYEFVWPMNDRLTDKKWRELLRSTEAPVLPDWTKEFIIK
jgi:hypothetical protein